MQSRMNRPQGAMWPPVPSTSTPKMVPRPSATLTSAPRPGGQLSIPLNSPSVIPFHSPPPPKLCLSTPRQITTTVQKNNETLVSPSVPLSKRGSGRKRTLVTVSSVAQDDDVVMLGESSTKGVTFYGPELDKAARSRENGKRRRAQQKDSADRLRELVPALKCDLKTRKPGESVVMEKTADYAEQLGKEKAEKDNILKAATATLALWNARVRDTFQKTYLTYKLVEELLPISILLQTQAKENPEQDYLVKLPGSKEPIRLSEVWFPNLEMALKYTMPDEMRGVLGKEEEERIKLQVDQYYEKYLKPRKDDEIPEYRTLNPASKPANQRGLLVGESRTLTAVNPVRQVQSPGGLPVRRVVAIPEAAYPLTLHAVQVQPRQLLNLRPPQPRQNSRMLSPEICSPSGGRPRIWRPRCAQGTPVATPRSFQPVQMLFTAPRVQPARLQRIVLRDCRSLGASWSTGRPSPVNAASGQMKTCNQSDGTQEVGLAKSQQISTIGFIPVIPAGTEEMVGNSQVQVATLEGNVETADVEKS